MNRNLVIANLNELTRAELSATAKQLGLSVGKSKSNTVSNIADAICGKKGARCTVQFTIRKGIESCQGGTVLSKKFRSARDGDTIVAPVGVAA